MLRNLILMPLVGALIGWLTNWIAIKMLFRPANPVYIGAFRVPLTPGLIPKEKKRLANAVGDAVGKTLLSDAQLTNALLAPEMRGKLEGILDQWILDMRGDTRTVRERFLRGLKPDTLEGMKSFVAQFLAARIREADLGQVAAQSAMQSLREKTKGGIGEKLGALVDDRIKQSVVGSIQSVVNNYIDHHADALMAQAVSGETDKLLDQRTNDLIARYENDIPALKEKLFELYERVIRDMLSGVLRTIDLANIVRDKIESIPNDDMEDMILAVVDRELKAIVTLGAVLGCIMGCVNLLLV